MEKIHLGLLLKKRLVDGRFVFGKVAAVLGIKPSAMTALMKSPDMKVSRMLEIEEKLGVDMVGALRPEWAVREKSLMDEAGTLKERVKELEMEVGVLNRVVGRS